MLGNVRSLEESLENRLKLDVLELREHIKSNVPDLGEVNINPSVSFSSGLKSAEISIVSSSGESINLDRAGAGRARRVSLAVWEFSLNLLSGAGDIVILYDEPDTNLDYAHQREFMDLVRKQCAHDNVRMVIATHSMNLIDRIDIANVVHLKHVGQRTTMERIFEDSDVGKYLQEIASSLGLRNTVLLHEKLFVGVEGDTEMASIPILFRTYKGQQLESYGIAIWPCGSNIGALKFAQYLVEHDRRVNFLIDLDSKTKRKDHFSDDKLRSFGLDPDVHALYLGNPNEIEDIFSDEQWAELGNSKWPRDDVRRWTATDFSVLRSGKFSDQLFELFKTESSRGPSKKSQVLTEMAMSISRDEIPRQLRDCFDALIDRAN